MEERERREGREERERHTQGREVKKREGNGSMPTYKWHTSAHIYTHSNPIGN